MNEIYLNSVLNSIEFNNKNKIAQTPEIPKEDFTKLIKDSINKVNELQFQADNTISDLSTENIDIDAAMISLQEADISFRTMMAVKNKLVQAYQEITKMNI